MNPYNDPEIKGSHAGEDLWILSHFPDGYQGYAVEVGAHDGHYLSNTWLLEKMGWTCLCIEPNPLLHEKLRERRKLVMTCACGNSTSNRAMFYHSPEIHMGTLAGLAPRYDGRRGKSTDARGEALAEVEVKTISECLSIAGFPKLDVLSIDVDGDDYEVLEGADLDKWNPSVVVIEDSDLTRPEIQAHLLTKKYEKAQSLGHNHIWIKP